MKIRQVRVEDAPQLARIKIKTWRYAYRGLIEQQVLDTLPNRETTEKWTKILETYPDADNRVGFVAEVFGEVIGYCFGILTEKKPWDLDLLAIYILPSFQGEGIGKTLIQRILLHFSEASSMIVWVLKGNEAIGFYERLGGVRTKTKSEKIGDRTYEVFGYLYDSETLEQLRTDP